MFKPVPIKLKRGEAVFHHPLAVHGSLENKYYLIMIMIMIMMTGQWSVANGSLENKHYLMMIIIMIIMTGQWPMTVLRIGIA